MKGQIFKLLLFFAVAFLLNSCSSEDSEPENISTSPQITIPIYTYSPLEEETLTLINSYRVSIGLNELQKNNYISLQSEEHDNYMISQNVPSHDNFNERLVKISNALGATKVGENVAYNYNSAKAVLDAWLKSPLHKECIEGDYTHFGIAIRENSQGKKYYTNIFAKIEDIQ